MTSTATYCDKYAKGRRGFLVLLVFFAVAFFYWPAVRHSFVNYDDNDYVLYNPHVLEGLSLKGLAWAATSVGYAWNWHPLTWMSLMADVSLSGSELRALRPDEPFPHPPHPAPVQRMSAVMHGHNVLLHAANAALLLLLISMIVRRYTGDDAPSLWCDVLVALVVLLWAVHPLRAEAVAWISERKELLCAFWSLLALIAHLLYRQVWPAVACLALAVAAKPVAVTLPAVMWALDLSVMEKVRWRRLTWCGLVAAIGCALTLVAQRGNMAGMELVSLDKRVLHALAAPVVYLRQMIWPAGLIHFYPISEGSGWIEVVLGAAVWAAGAIVCIWAVACPAKAKRLAVLAASWCLVGLLPMSGIIQVGSQLHADRYTYWIGAGLVACAAAAIAGFAVRGDARPPVSGAVRRGRFVILMVVAAILVPYGVCGFRQIAVWRDSGALLKHAYETSGTAKAATDWAEYLVEENPVEAERVYRVSLTRGAVPPALSGLAFLLAVKQEASDFAEAKRLAAQALEMAPDEHRARVALGICAIREDRLWDAERILSEAVAEDAADVMAAGLRRQVRARCTPAGK